MSFPPNAYLIGAQKAGTTTLAYLLDQHPEISVSKPKETHFFSNNYHKGMGWYKSKFTNPANVCIDASTSYSMAPSSGCNKRNKIPERIHVLIPDAKFIYILRNPVERTYAGYWHNVRAGREKRNFIEAIKYDPIYLDISNYYGQLEVWFKYFSIESFKFILFESLKANPEGAARDCFKHLGLDESVDIYFNDVKNKSYYVNWLGRKANRLMDYTGTNMVFSFIYDKCSVGMQKRIKRMVNGYKNIPQIKKEDKAMLYDYFFNKNERLSQLIGIPLDMWKY